jgi:hypothetical protein
MPVIKDLSGATTRLVDMNTWSGSSNGPRNPEQPKPWPFTDVVSAATPIAHSLSRCYCGDCHTEFEVNQLNQPVTPGVTPPPTIWPARSRRARQQDHTGWLRTTVSMPTGSGVRDLLGPEYFTRDQLPDEPAGKVCGWCGGPLTGKQEQYCKPVHRVMASKRRHAEAAAQQHR